MQKNKESNRMIGIIGGNGVAATNKLLSLIEEIFTKNGAFRDCHHPEMIVWQATQAPSRSMYLEGRGPSWIEDYLEIGRKLKDCGCSKLCMCCNTAHYAIDDLQNRIGLPFLNLLNEVALECHRRGAKRVGMMCTDGLRKYEIYDSRFKLIAPEIEVVYPNNEYQELVTKGICNAKNSIRFNDCSKTEDHPVNCFNKVCKHLILDKDVDCIVAGCTDIRNVFRFSSETVMYIDSLEVLANAIIRDEKNVSK